MNTYRLKISYNGTHYLGWQIQPDTLKTVQGQLNHILQKISKSEDVSTLGSGRTDTGVHAVAQIVKVTMPLDIGPSQLVKGLNSLLPNDIRIIEAQVENEKFHPVRDALWKRYAYYFWIGDTLPPSGHNKVMHERNIFDLKLFENALRKFEGTHDFKNFSTKGTIIKSTERTLYRAQVKEATGFFPYQENFQGKLYRVIFEGNGFLKQMVRLLVGTALMAARNKVSTEEIEAFFQQDRTDKLGPVAPPDGLYLEHVEYQHPWGARD